MEVDSTPVQVQIKTEVDINDVNDNIDVTPVIKKEVEEACVIPSTSIQSDDVKPLKLKFCEVCSTVEAKYTCPRCEVRTCSLKCSTIHKKELECDGARDRTKYIPMKKFDNLDMSSDYRLLEEIGRSLENITKERRQNHMFNKTLPYFMERLRNATYRRKTHLQYLPYTFQRRKKNTTRLNFQEDIIYWHISWIFINADGLELFSTQVSENDTLSLTLSNLLNSEDSLVNEQLKFYRSADLAGIRLFLRAERKKGRKYYELDRNLPIKDCLRGKTIIEYPIIEVVLKDHVNHMDIIDSDDEEAMETNIKHGDSVINNIIKKGESEESLYNALKNLLFVSEHSDGELSE